MDEVLPLGGKVLRGRHIALEPLTAEHRTGLAEAGRDEAIFTHMPFETKGAAFARHLDWLASENAAERWLTYVVRRLADDAIVGSTSYLSLAPEHAKVEIGGTWYAAGAQGSFVNPEAKYLLLGNAFACRYNRVEFKTNSKNARSRTALAKLGAKEEGVLRGHMWVPQGYFRDSVYFSILASEWPEVKAGLERRLASFGAQ